MIHELLEAGKRYSSEQQYDKAIAQFEQIIKLSPGNAHAHFELGKVYFLQNRRKAAKAELTHVLAGDTSNVYARLLLGKIHKAEGDFEKAKECFAAVMESGYHEENLAKEIADLCRQTGQYGLALSFLEKAREQGYPPDRYRDDLNGICHEQIRKIQNYNFEGRYRETLEEIKKASSVIPRDNLMMQNSILSEQEIALKKPVLDCTMKSLTFTLTNRCNLACLMCETRKIPWDLPEKIKKEIITLLPYLERIMWQGGEAFLYEGFEELLDEAGRYPIRQVLATNGMLITERIAEKLVRYNVELTFSIDGNTKEVYEHIRPGARFEKVIENVRLVNELREKNNPGMRTRLNVLVMRANYRQLEDFIEFAHRYKFSTLFFNSTGCDFKNLQENVFYYNRDADIIEYINTVRDRISEKAREYGITLENWLPSKKFIQGISEEGKAADPAPKAELQPEPVKKEQKLFCHAPWQRLYIDCGGRVRPDCLCPFERDIGNLKESGLMELWNGEKLVNFRKKMISGEYKEYCNNDCVYGRVPEKNLKYI